jgi:hypothetical protein
MRKVVWSSFVLCLFLAVAMPSAVSLNPTTGRVAHGVGGAGAYLDNTALSTAGAGGTSWVDAFTVIYQVCDGGTATGCRLETYDVRNGSRATVDRLGANYIAAGGGVWAKWLGGPYGLLTSTGFACAECGLIAVGPDGAVAYKPQYQSNGPFLVRERDGTSWKFSDVPAYDVQLLGQRRAIWTTAQQVFTTGIPKPTTISPAVWRPRVANVAGEWWVAYWTNERGLVVHPFTSIRGYVVRTTPDAFSHDMIAIGRSLRVSFATNEGETPGSVVTRDINIDTEPRVDLTIVPPPPPPEPVSVKPAAVSVDKFTLTPKANLPDGTVFEIRDPNNPQLGTRVRAWVVNGSIFFSIDYPGAGAGLLGQTGARRPVR